MQKRSFSANDFEALYQHCSLMCVYILFQIGGKHEMGNLSICGGKNPRYAKIANQTGV